MPKSYSCLMGLAGNNDLLKEFKRRADAALPGRVARVILFGSRARGEATRDSDWDLAVFLTGAPTARDRGALSDAAYDLLLERGQLIQPIAIAAHRLDDGTLFLRRIRQEGITV